MQDKYNVTVHFKPEGIPKEDASSTKTITFEVQGTPPRSTLYKVAKDKIVEAGKIDSDILEDYWEPYKIESDRDVKRPLPPRHPTPDSKNSLNI